MTYRIATGVEAVTRALVQSRTTRTSSMPLLYLLVFGGTDGVGCTEADVQEARRAMLAAVTFAVRGARLEG